MGPITSVRASQLVGQPGGVSSSLPRGREGQVLGVSPVPWDLVCRQ